MLLKESVRRLLQRLSGVNESLQEAQAIRDGKTAAWAGDGSAGGPGPLEPE